MKLFTFPFIVIAFLVGLLFSGALDNPSPFVSTPQAKAVTHVITEPEPIQTPPAPVEMAPIIEEAYTSLEALDLQIPEGEELKATYIETVPEGTYGASQSYIPIPSVEHPESDHIFEVELQAVEVPQTVETPTASIETSEKVLTCEEQGLLTAEDNSCVNPNFWDDAPTEVTAPTTEATASTQDLDTAVDVESIIELPSTSEDVTKKVSP